MAHGNGGKRHDASIPYDAKRCPDLSESNPPPEDRRIGTPEVDREPLATIPVLPNFDKAEDAVKMGGKGYSRGSTTDADED
jgi:hypothetical protein